MFDATRIRLYPTDEQAHCLAVQFGCARWVWNNALALSQETYRATGNGLTATNIRAEGLRILAGGQPATASGGNVSRGPVRKIRVRAVA